MSVTPIEIVRRFPHYRRGKKLCHFVEHESRQLVEDSDPLLRTIFAPDPVTGFPSSDLAIMLSKDSAPEVAQYVRDVLQRPLHTSSGIDDPDFALEATRGSNEDFLTYAERLRELCKVDKED